MISYYWIYVRQLFFLDIDQDNSGDLENKGEDKTAHIEEEVLMIEGIEFHLQQVDDDPKETFYKLIKFLLRNMMKQF